jgi:thiosulfate/3-mercaptopyruvate sulfurtransferase
VPFTELFVGGEMGGTFKSPDEMKAVFSKAGVDLNKQVICSCGSGCTAAILSMGVYMVTGNLAAVYDGSWMEWASVPGNPIVTDKSD